MIPSQDAVAEAQELMLRFAERTGLDRDGPGASPQRYLWTDAFAVCNYLALARATGAARHEQLALDLVGQVHRVLGRHRPDDPRRGWISGLPDPEGERHPTRGGLRIGKPLPERARGVALDEQLEWERDGQYFHYLTKWMHALDQLARATREARFNTWARELAEVAHRAFSDGAPGRGSRRMAWKLSTDLSRALVPSMGQHDPLDGWVTCRELQATAASLPGAPLEPRLDAAVADFAQLARGQQLATADPLGIGGLLLDAGRVAQLMGRGALPDPGLLDALLAAALAGLAHYERQGGLRRPAAERLAFRELGLGIGLAALAPLRRAVETSPAFPDRAGARVRLAALERRAALGAAIASFWREPAPRRARTWSEHRDISEVMLASCLVPEGVVVLWPAADAASAGRGGR